MSKRWLWWKSAILMTAGTAFVLGFGNSSCLQEAVTRILVAVAFD